MSLENFKNKLVEDFLTYLEVEKNRSAKTIENYRFYLARFYAWANKNLSRAESRSRKYFLNPHKINLPLIRQYRIYLNRFLGADNEPLKRSTQNYHLIALRSYLKYLARQNIKSLPAEHIELAKVPERQVSFLDKEELERLLEAPTKNISEPKLGDLRDRAILEILFSTGLRVSELCRLKIKDINLRKKNSGALEFTVRGKGKKLRLVFLSEQACFWLKKYLERRMDLSPWMFIRMDSAAVPNGAKDEKPINPRSIERLVEKYAKLAGMTKKVSPHTLRHTFATDLLANDADIRSVQTLLGHSSITTTQIYTHITNRRLRETYNKYHNKAGKQEHR